MYSVKVVISFFLNKSAMSPKKLQKMLYYAYCWVLALLNEDINQLDVKLFDERIEAWVHGPVIPAVYKKYKRYGGKDIRRIKNSNNSIFSCEVFDILNQVWGVYGGFSGNQLETISHQEAPWINARKGIPPYEACNNIISDRDIFYYFNEQASK